MSKKTTNEEPEQEYLHPHDCWVPVKKSALEVLANMDINTTLYNLISNIAFQYEHFLSAYNTEEQIEEIKRNILTLEINDKTIINYNYHLFEFSGNLKREEYIEITLHTSLIYVSMAQIALEDDHISIAWRAISNAEYNLGLSIGLINYSALAKAERSKKGNEKRHENKLHIKQIILDAMMKHRPVKGWKTVFRAVDDIIETMEETIKNENLPLPKNRDYLIEKLRNIITDDDELYEAINEQK